MHPFSTLTIGIFVAGYITARWDLVTRLYELAIFAWDHAVFTRAAKGFVVLSLFFFLFIVPADRLALAESNKVCVTAAIYMYADRFQHPRSGARGISAREQLKRRGSI
jgi:hypothetical protein